LFALPLSALPLFALPLFALPLFAAQRILPGDTLTHGQSGNVETRRRIEIRIRRRDTPAQ
jgi:hypothetical protein